ncbi:serine/threonine-protein kinase [Nonomuraea antimicrobica]|uniref:non-specific serine/threonine protein kinase n=1 Tax=Nonomuraea antimicrobica TaxID=561173 RepID=A0ABP7BXQ4_9ACTN
MAQGGSEASLGSRYVLLDEIGAGAMGTVWRARQRDTGEIVAVKLLRDGLAGDPDLVLRFVQERNVMRALRHPNIVTVRDFVIEGDRLALVMDLIEGADLRTLLRQRGTLPPAEAARLTARIADALAAAHAVGIVHRDVKPGNVLIEGATGQVRLTDFGVARIVHGPGLTQTSSVLGTPAYLAPEVADGDAPTAAVDVYALGLIAYELLAGRPPFAGEHPMALLRQHATAVPRRLPGMPDALWSVVWACLAKDPAARPATRAVAVALDEAAASLAGWTALPPVPRGEAASATSEPLARPVPAGQDAPPAGTGGTSPGSADAGIPASEWTMASSRRGRSRQRLVIVATTVVALTVTAVAVGVVAPWRERDTGVTPVNAAASAPGTHGPAETSVTSISTPPKDAGRALSSPKAQDDPISAPPTAPKSTEPRTPTAQTPKPRRSTPKGTVPAEDAPTDRPTDKPTDRPTDEPADQDQAPSWRCRAWIAADAAGTTQMAPCVAVVGDVFYLRGQIRGSVSSDIHVQLYDTDADRNVSQPFLCTGVTPVTAQEVATCGPFKISIPRTGAKIDVRQRWRKAGTTAFSGGAESPWVRW